MTRPTPPFRTLRERPDLEQLKRQAKKLLAAFRAGETEAVAEVQAHYHGAQAASFALHDAQLVLARSYGFASWPQLKAHVDGITVRRLVDAVRAGDLEQVRAMLAVRPELVHLDLAANDEHRALHHAVLIRAPEMVRLLMEHGADARKGIYPHRDATGALTLARERGYDEIVALIEEAEQRRRETRSGSSASSAADELCEAIAGSDEARAMTLLEANPALVHASDRDGWTPLHAAAARLNERLVAWMLERGADANRGGKGDKTPLDVAAITVSGRQAEQRVHFQTIADMLRQRGAELTLRSAVALGQLDWLRARHAEGTLVNPIETFGGLLTLAVKHDQAKVLELLLDYGFDPNERVRVEDLEEPVFSEGMPLWACAASGKRGLAELLLKRGANPNASVYASGSAVFQAYGQRDEAMIALLERYGGVVSATTAGLYRRTELARRMLAGEIEVYVVEEEFAGKTLAEQLLWSAACGGDPEIVRLALERVDWPRDDPRWYRILEQPLRFWNHGPGHWANPTWDRSTYLTCFRLVLERCDASIRGRFGLTILHDLAASRRHMRAEEGVAFATLLLDAGARLDVRDDLLRSTPLGWACRWGRVELVRLLLERGADPVEADAEPWATPRTWAEKRGHRDVLALLDGEHPGP